MSTTMLSGNKDPNKPKNTDTNGASGMDLSYGANAGAGGTTPTGGVTGGQGSAPVTGTMSAPTGGEPVATDGSLSYSANAGTGTSPATAPTTPKVTLSPEQAAYDADGDGVLTYEEYESFKRGITQQFWTDYQRSEQNRLQVQKDATYAQAAEAKRRAEEAAERAHERAVVDAQVAGEQNKASYGANAERVAEMGVVGGGYSDYLNAQSYATERAEIAGAGAQKTAAFRLAADNETDARLAADLSYGNNMAEVEQAAAKGMLDADLTYAGNMQTHDEKEKEKQEAEEEQNLANAEAAILSAITAGTYKTKDEAIAAAKAKGITDENVLSNIESQWMIFDNGIKNSEAAATAFYGNIEHGDYATLAEAMEAANAAGITDANILASIDNKWTAWAVSSFTAAIERGDYTTKEAAVQAARDAGITSESVLGKIGDAWDAWDESKQDKVKTDAYNTIASNIENGDYATVEAALAAAAENGITDEKVLEQIKAGWNAWNKEYTNTYNSNYAIVEEMAKNGNYTADEIRSWCERLGINKDDDINALLGFVQKNTMDYSALIESGELTTDHIKDIEKGVESDDISAEDAEKWRADWVDGLMNTEDAFLDQNGARYSKKDATEILNNTINNAWCTPELEAHLKTAFNKIYATKQIKGITVANDELPERTGGNVYVDYGGNRYSFENGGEASGDVVAAAADCADGSFFVYGDGVYFKTNGKVYITKPLFLDPAGSAYKRFIDALKANGVFAAAPVVTSVTTPTGDGGSVTEEKYSYDHGGKSTLYTITNPDGTKKNIWSVRGH